MKVSLALLAVGAAATRISSSFGGSVGCNDGPWIWEDCTGEYYKELCGDECGWQYHTDPFHEGIAYPATYWLGCEQLRNPNDWW